jgi:hypothetical protein
MNLTKENLIKYIKKCPEPELRKITVFLANALNQKNLADLSPYFKVRMRFEPPTEQKKDVSEGFKQKIRASMPKEKLEKLRTEKLLQDKGD